MSAPVEAISGVTEPVEMAGLIFPLLDATEAGRMLGGIPRRTVMDYARDNRLPSIKIGDKRFFCRGQLAQHVARVAAHGEGV